MSTRGTADRVSTVLAAAVGSVAPAGAGTWTFACGDAPTRGLARLEDGWLDLTVAAGRITAAAGAWSVLEQNATLAGGLRLVLAPGGGLDLRADVALDELHDDHALAARFGVAIQSLARATKGPTPAPASSGTLPSDMLAQCRATGWPVEPRGDTAVAVDLGVPAMLEHAVVAARADGTFVVTVPLVDEAERAATDVSRRAVARLALRLAGLVRLVRTAADPNEPTSLRFETIVGAATTTDLAHAFAALAVACRLGAAEVTALLHDEAVARLYLQHPHDAAVPQAA